MIQGEQTIDSMRRLLLDLAQVGEVSLYDLKGYGLRDYHLLKLGETGLVTRNPYAMLATPRFLNLLPVADDMELATKLGLCAPGRPGKSAGRQSWDSFERRIFELSIPNRRDDLGYEYCFTHKPGHEDGAWSSGAQLCPIWEERVNRPVFLYCYMPPGAQIDEWDPQLLAELARPYTSRKWFVHSALNLTRGYGRERASLARSVWEHPIYWLVMQLLVLSDPETGLAYEYRIALYLSRRFLDPAVDSSPVPIVMDDRPVCDFCDVVEDVMRRFRWVWVNRAESPAEARAQLLSVLKLLFRTGIMDRGGDGRLCFTDVYRRQLFRSGSVSREYYLRSHDAREQIREMIKRKSGEQDG